MLTVENAHATAQISLFGGQVLQFRPSHDGRERLFLSSRAILDGSKSIRGGIPVCWPWFGAYKGPSPQAGLPAHGYARMRRWELTERVEDAAGTRLHLELPETKGPGFEGTAGLELEIFIGRQLRVALHTTNTGAAPFPLSAALHTYFAVSDIRQLQLNGLSGSYSDKTQDWAMLPTPSPYRFHAETDRIHLLAAEHLQIADQNQVTDIHSNGHDSIVVWNPWSTGSLNFADLRPEDYLGFLCVETALTQGFVLEPGRQHVLQQTIS